MGSIKLREALRCLCDEIGWSYAVFWRSVRSGSSMHLVWEDGRVVENRMEVLVHKIMAQQVHIFGAGIVGQAAATGCHRWVVTDDIHVNAPGSKDLAELEHQFSAGIQTVTVIPLLRHGVLQLGCTQMVMENIRFVNHVKNLFGQLDCVTGSLLPDGSQKALSQNSQLLNGIPVVVSEMLPDQLTITNSSVRLSDAFQPIIYPVCEQNLLVNGQSVTRPLGDRRILCNSDTSLIPSAFTHDSALNYQYQQSARTSVLSSISLPLPEQQLAMFSINSWEATNGIGPESDITKAFPIRSHGLVFPDSIEVSNIPSLSRSDTGDSVNAVGMFSSQSGSTREASSSPYPNLSSTEVVQMLSLGHLQSRHGILIDPSPSFLSVNTPEPAATAGSQKQEHFLCTTYDVPSIKSDLNGLCNQALLSTLKECTVSSSNAFLEDQCYDNAISDANGTKISLVKLNNKDDDESKYHHVIPMESTSGNDLYDILGSGYKIDRFGGNCDDVLENKNDASNELAADNSTCMAQLDVCITRLLDDSVSGVGMVSIADANQLLDAMVSKINSGTKENSDDGVYQRTSITNTCSSSAPVVSSCNKLITSDQMQGKSLSLPPLGKVEVLGSSSSNSACSLGNIMEDCYQSAGICKSQISLWVENGASMHANNLSGSQSKKIEEKSNRKRARPGENPRPRPKDRQMIMDRVKELREIIPNGAKQCSIDGLLEKTIKHMLFLQSVTKHADNLKDIGEPKFISKEGGILLKGKFEGDTTFAFQVGSQSMTSCPIIVEDLNPPRQMLVEMLCEQHGVFLEIADLIRGLGLTILKGVMEAYQDKIWARFAVEADRDVTSMEIFRSIVCVLESTVGCGKVPQGMDNIYQQSCIAATGTSTQLL